ncbi:MAG: hypothetical protein QF471_03290 [Phycisphaerales bacterium]|jgi:hypothetical protein|nr:hypothetical protein [Phycisphaerales bacterium]
MEAPFRIRSDLARVIEHGHLFALGVESGGLRPHAVGWSQVVWGQDQPHPETVTYTIAVSHELVRPLLHELMRMLPGRVSGLMELGSRDAYREVDVYIGHPIDLDHFLGAWDLFEPILLEDATIGVGVNAVDPFFEIFLDQDKRLIIHVDPSWASGIEDLLQRFNVQRRHDDDIQPIPTGNPVRVRSVLEQREGFLADPDHLLLALQASWLLELDDDPDRNLDARGRDIGYTLWRGLVLVDQEDPAGRRVGHAQMWGVATCRRDIERLMQSHIVNDFEWEFRQILNLDRIAFDDRPAVLNDLQSPLEQDEVLLYDVLVMGTAPAGWDGRDG